MSLPSRLALAAATATAAAGAIAAGPPETGFDRPGGVYSNVPAKDPAACAIACAQDRICMSWSFRATEFVGCSLKAVVPAAVPDKLAVSGVADRAGDFLSLVSVAPPQPAPASEAASPAPVANLAAMSKADPPAQTATAPEAQDSAPELLGAPASLTRGINQIAPATFKSIALVRGALPENTAPIVEIAIPQPLLMTTISAPNIRAALQQRLLTFETAALVIEPEPEPLIAPTPLQTMARLVAPTVRATIQQRRPTFETAALVLPEEPAPLAPPVTVTARLTAATRVVYRAPPVLMASAPMLTPIVSIEAPVAPPKAMLVIASAAPRALQSPRAALNDHIVLALPSTSLAEQPSANAQPAAYATAGQAVLSQASAVAPPEEELLGAP